MGTVFFKECITTFGNQKTAHLRELFERQGWRVTEGIVIADTPMMRLCVRKRSPHSPSSSIDATTLKDYSSAQG